MSDHRHLENKRLLKSYYDRLDAAEASVEPVLEAVMAPDARYFTIHPINALNGRQAVADALFAPLRRSIPGLRHRPYAMMAGHFADRDWACAFGVLEGAMMATWLGIPATLGLVHLRFGEFHQIHEGRIVESYAIYDLIDLMRQAGIDPLPKPPLGAPAIFPAPAPQDGISLAASDPAVTRDSLALVEQMIFGLMQYDQTDLKSMGMQRFWHPDMLWYGPGGTGATARVGGFQDYHQKPFLGAFPDRVGGNHKARFADGPYVASTGWPSIHATHVGPWLGVPGQGNRIEMRVMDWWRCEQGLLRENWVFIDVAHVLLQSGYDVFARLADHPGSAA